MNRHIRADFHSIPIIDFAAMLTGDPAAKAAAKLRSS
jgi:hypothetical protein